MFSLIFSPLFFIIICETCLLIDYSFWGILQVCPTDNLKIGYKNKREKGIFQRRYYEHTIKNETEFNNKINYIHYNPVKHGLVKKVKDCPYSFFHKFIEQNLYDINWGSEADIKNIVDLYYE